MLILAAKRGREESVAQEEHLLPYYYPPACQEVQTKDFRRGKHVARLSTSIFHWHPAIHVDSFEAFGGVLKSLEGYSGQCQDSDWNWPMRGLGWPLTRGIGQWQPARTLTTAPISSSEGWTIIGDNISQVLMAQNTIPITRCEFQGYYHCLTFWPSLLQIVVFGILKG